jgi:hypothetical protein
MCQCVQRAVNTLHNFERSASGGGTLAARGASPVGFVDAAYDAITVIEGEAELRGEGAGQRRLDRPVHDVAKCELAAIAAKSVGVTAARAACEK